MSRENPHFLSEDSFLNKLTFPSFFICDGFFLLFNSRNANSNTRRTAAMLPW